MYSLQFHAKYFFLLKIIKIEKIYQFKGKIIKFQRSNISRNDQKSDVKKGRVTFQDQENKNVNQNVYFSEKLFLF